MGGFFVSNLQKRECSMNKLLINKKTKVIFPYHELLVKNKDIVPYDEEVFGALGSTKEPEPTGATSSNGIIISRANKAELIEFAYTNFGVVIEDDQTVPVIREQVKRLVEAG